MRHLLFLALLLAACAPSQSPRSGTFTGYYSIGMEGGTFVPLNSKERWSLSGQVPCVDEILAKLPIPPDISLIIYLKARGSVGARGEYGHLGVNSRVLNIDEVLECRREA